MASSQALNTNPPAARIVATNEKVTGPPAAEMLRTCLEGATGSLEILDNACGGGILTAELLKYIQQVDGKSQLKRAVASDTDVNMISYVERRVHEHDWQHVTTMKADQRSIPTADSTFTHVFNNFGAFFVPDAHTVLAETLRITKTGGTVGFTSWKSINWWPEVAIPAIEAFVPDAPALPPPRSVFPPQNWHDSTAIQEKLRTAGFDDIEVEDYSFAPDVEAEEFAEACAVLVKIITKRTWSAEDHSKYEHQIEPALLRYLREQFPGGKWNGTMTAIISIGRKPGTLHY